jgi:hypothetical protein
LALGHQDGVPYRVPDCISLTRGSTCGNSAWPPRLLRGWPHAGRPCLFQLHWGGQAARVDRHLGRHLGVRRGHYFGEEGRAVKLPELERVHRTPQRCTEFAKLTAVACVPGQFNASVDVTDARKLCRGRNCLDTGKPGSLISLLITAAYVNPCERFCTFVGFYPIEE